MATMKTVVFWVVTVRNLIPTFFRNMLHPSDGDDEFCQNTRHHTPEYGNFHTEDCQETNV